MRSRTALGVVVIITVVAVVAPGFALGQSAPGGGQAQPTPVSTATNTTIAIHPRPSGDARFRVSTTFRLDNSNESAAFRALARAFEDGDAGFSVSTFRQAANQSSLATGRPMTLTNVTRNATIVGENTSGADTGKLVLGFTWTNFARTSGDRLVVGDAFTTTRETWLPGLTENQVLLIEAPRQYVIVRSPVGFANGTIRFEGPAQFEPGSPSVVFERRAFGQPNRGANDDGSGLFTSPSLFVLGAGVIVLGCSVLGAYVLTRRDGTDEHRTTGEPIASTPDENPDDVSTDASAATAEEELLSDEERVERLLERNDGRMKQASIVAETGWSNAKVSQLLSAMDEDSRINKLRIGRENLISLPDEE